MRQARRPLRSKHRPLLGSGFNDDSACSQSSRVVRGGVGFLLGGLLGGMIGGGVALAVTTAKFDVTEPIEAVKRAKNMALLASGITVVGAASGLVIGSWRPEC